MQRRISVDQKITITKNEIGKKLEKTLKYIIEYIIEKRENKRVKS